MGFFNDLSKKASEAYNVTKEKTSKISGEIKLKSKINEAKNKIENLQTEIGKLIYEEYKAENKGENNETITAKCEEIVNLEKEIKNTEDAILELKNIKKCISCGAELTMDMEFCSKCGTKQPVIEKVEEKAEETTTEETSDNNEDNKEE